MIFTVLMILILSLGCATNPYTVAVRYPLKKQILRHRPHYKGLTNSRCLKWGHSNCLELEIIEYNMHDEKFRKTLNTLGFVCFAGRERWKVCLDQPSYCRMSKCRKKFLSDERVCNIQRLDIDGNEKFLLDTAFYCRVKRLDP